jgi:ABC-type branched-subunit amino acid transport system substrate-binding protein
MNLASFYRKEKFMRLLGRLSVLAGAAVLAVACSSSGGGGSGAAPATTAGTIKAGPGTGWSDGGFTPDLSSYKCNTKAPNPTRGITPTSIKIGGLATLTSPTGSSMAGTEVGAKVRFDRVNASGGVNGRKIDYIGVLDDGQDPARDGTQAAALVQQKGVFAAVPVMTSVTNYLDTFCGAVVPFFGWGTNNGYCSNAIGFGINGCATGDPTQKVSSDVYGLAMQALFGTAGGKTAAIVAVDNDTARRASKNLATQIQETGTKVVYNQSPVPAAGLADTTAVVNAIMRSNKGGQPDVVFYLADFTTSLKLTQALGAAGFTGKNLNPVAYDPRLETFKGLDKSYIVLQWEPGIDTANPAIAQMAADFAKYAPGQVLSLPAMSGYWAADFFVGAATKTGRNLTVDSLLKVLNSGYSNYVPGAVPQTRWPLNHFVAPPCLAITQLNVPHYSLTYNLHCGSLIAG